jgi:hypothetical protein
VADFLAESRALQEVARELNRVKTIGQARGAAGAALVEISKGYTLAKKVGTIWSSEAQRQYAIEKRLTTVREEIEAEYRVIDKAANYNALIATATWTRLRNAINKAYGELFSLQVQLGDVPTVGGVLRESIQDLPQTVVTTTKVVAKAAVKGATAVGNAAVAVAEGAASWLQRLIITIVIVIVIALLVKKKVGL